MLAHRYLLVEGSLGTPCVNVPPALTKIEPFDEPCHARYSLIGAGLTPSNLTVLSALFVNDGVMSSAPAFVTRRPLKQTRIWMFRYARSVPNGSDSSLARC